MFANMNQRSHTMSIDQAPSDDDIGWNGPIFLLTTIICARLVVHDATQATLYWLFLAPFVCVHQWKWHEIMMNPQLGRDVVRWQFVMF